VRAGERALKRTLVVIRFADLSLYWFSSTTKATPVTIFVKQVKLWSLLRQSEKLLYQNFFLKMSHFLKRLLEIFFLE
jgi:hypothetical protein